MGKTIAEKILARASGCDSVEPGDYVTAKVDLEYNLDEDRMHRRVVKAGLPDGIPEVADPEGLVITVGDHWGCHGPPFVPASLKRSRQLAKKYGVEKVYDINTGVCHTVMADEGLVRPGMLVCGEDSHGTTTGALNAAATPISMEEVAWIHYTGELWFRVPESIKFVCGGKLADGVTAKDVFLFVIGKYAPSLAQYKSLEWKGPVIDAMGMDGRFTLSCQSIELGAKFAPFEPDDTCLEYIASTPYGDGPFWPTFPDADAVYENVYEEDLTDIEPQVALPHGFDVVRRVSEVEGIKVDQCNLGSCASGRYDDLAMVARIVKGKKVKARTILSPGSWKTYRKALENGVLGTLVDAGVMVVVPSCIPCSGLGANIADGEVAIAATTRNFRGRFGTPNSEIYLASPATAAASAVMGRITDPRKLL